MKTLITIVIDPEDGSDLTTYTAEATSTTFALELLAEWITNAKAEGRAN